MLVLLLLLLLLGRRVRGPAGLRDTGGVLQLHGLFGDLLGVLRHMFPLLRWPIPEGRHDDVTPKFTQGVLVPHRTEKGNIDRTRGAVS